MEKDPRSAKSWLRTYELIENPRYLVEFGMKVGLGGLAKHHAQLGRRLLKGRCYQQPSMGISDYPADIQFVSDSDPDDAPKPELQPQPITIPLGKMAHYWTWKNTSKPGRKVFSRKPNLEGTRVVTYSESTPVLFDAWLENGVLNIPKYPDLVGGEYVA